MRTRIAGDVLRFIRRYSKKRAPEPIFNTLAMRVFHFQFRNNGFYRRFCEMEGATPEVLKSWKCIPAMPAPAFKELRLIAFPSGKIKRTFKTSGTTFQRSRGASARRGMHHFETLSLYEASILPPFKKHVLQKGGFAFYFLMPPAFEAPHSSLSHMMKVVNARFSRGKGRYYVRKGQLQFKALARDLKKERKKVLLMTTAFALKSFLEYTEEKKLRFCLRAGSRLMETGGFKGRTREVPKTVLYRLCREWLGIDDFVGEYGMTELSSQYYSRKGGSFVPPAWMRTVVVDPQNGNECQKGKVGILRHVDLANLGSVMAVQTEDLGRAKGDGFEFMGRAKGSQARGCSLSYERFLKGFE